MVWLAFLLALPSRAACPDLPKWQVEERGTYVAWDEAPKYYERLNHCAQPRLQAAWRPLPGGASATAVRGARVSLVVPQVFIDRALSHLEKILAAGGARFLFFMDLNHGHFHMKKDLFVRRHGRLWAEGRWAELYESFLADPDLEVVYHSQELISPKRPPREFLGRFKLGAAVLPLDALHPDERMRLIQGTQGLFDFEFRAHPDGAFALSDGTRFDFSFEGEDWESDFRRIGVVRPSRQPVIDQ